jgi:hypothetical protein
MSFATSLACLPSDSIDVRRSQQSTGYITRTVNDDLHLFVNALHIATYTLYLDTHIRHLVTYVLRRHSCLFTV